MASRILEVWDALMDKWITSEKADRANLLACSFFDADCI